MSTIAALSNPTKAISVFSNKPGEMPGDKRAAVYGMEESVRHYCAEEGVCPNYVFGTLKGRWNVSKLPQKVSFCKGNCGLEHGKVQHIKDKITWRTGVCCYKEIHGVDCAKCADNTCPCAPTREIADARAHKVGMCPLSESNYDNTRVAREAYIAKEKAKLATANKTGEIPPLSEEDELEAQDLLDIQLMTPEEKAEEAEEADKKAWAFNNACRIMINMLLASQMAVVAEGPGEDREMEDNLLAQFWAAEEQREAEEKAAAQQEAKAASAVRWSCFNKPQQVAVKAPTVAPAVRGALLPVGTVADMEMEYSVGMKTNWGIMCGY